MPQRQLGLVSIGAGQTEFPTLCKKSIARFVAFVEHRD